MVNVNLTLLLQSLIEIFALLKSIVTLSSFFQFESLKRLLKAAHVYLLMVLAVSELNFHTKRITICLE